MSISSALKRAGLFWLMLAASFPVAEGVFRALGDRPSEDLAGLFAPFGDGSYKLGTHVDTEATWAAGKFSVHTDALGLRCDAARRFSTQPGERLDVLFLGDSQGFGHGVSFEDSLAGSLAVHAAADKLRVANAAVGGHGARNQLALAQWLRSAQRVSASDYIVLATPVFAHNPDSFTRASVGADGRLYDASNQKPTPSARFRLWLKTHSTVYGRLRNAFRNSSSGSKPAENADLAFQLYNPDRADASASGRLRQFLSDLKTFAAEQGARVSLVYIPLTVEVEFDAMARAGAARGLKLDPELPSRLCAAAAREAGISFHDLRPVVARLHQEGDPLRLKGDFHYNPVLSKACADYLWPRLRTDLAPAKGS